MTPRTKQMFAVPIGEWIKVGASAPGTGCTQVPGSVCRPSGGKNRCLAHIARDRGANDLELA